MKQDGKPNLAARAALAAAAAGLLAAALLFLEGAWIFAALAAAVAAGSWLAEGMRAALCYKGQSPAGTGPAGDPYADLEKYESDGE